MGRGVRHTASKSCKIVISAETNDTGACSRKEAVCSRFEEGITGDVADAATMRKVMSDGQRDKQCEDEQREGRKHGD